MSINCAARVLVAAVVLIGPTAASAQQIGLKGGVNFASLTPEEDESPDMSRRVGFAGGAWLLMPVTERFAIQAEGLFSEKGVKFDASALGAGEVDVRVRYFEIPILARGDFGAAGSTARLFLIGGAAPAFKLSGRGSAEIDGREETQDLDDDLEPVDVGLVGGAGVEFGRLLVEARYTHGLLKINKDDNDPEDSIQNRVFTVLFGFRFR